MGWGVVMSKRYCVPGSAQYTTVLCQYLRNKTVFKILNTLMKLENLFFMMNEHSSQKFDPRLS